MSDIKLFSTTKIGHFGTGDLKVAIKSHPDFEKAKTLILKSYEGSLGGMGEGTIATTTRVNAELMPETDSGQANEELLQGKSMVMMSRNSYEHHFVDPLCHI